MKKSVLMIIQNLPVPHVKRIWMEAFYLKKHGYQVAIISPAQKDQKLYEIVSGIHIYRYPQYFQPGRLFYYFIEYLYSLTFSFYLALKIFIKHGFSVIHVGNPPDFLFLIALFFKPFGVKFVYDQHDLNPELFICKFRHLQKTFKFKLIHRLLYWLESWSLKSCDLHLASSQSAQEIVLDRNRFKAPSILIRNAVFNKDFKVKSKIDRRYLKKTKKFKHLALYYGVMGPQDGLDKLLRSIQKVVYLYQRPDIGFVFLGDGEQLPFLKKLARKLKISKNIIFAGWAEDQKKYTFFSVANIGLMPDPSNEHSSNSLHNKILEYMEAGLPFVSYDLREAKLTAKKAVIAIKNDDETKFAKAIVRLMNQPLKIQYLGQYAQRRIKYKKLTYTDAVKPLFLAYKYILFQGIFVKERFYGEKMYKFKPFVIKNL